MSDLVRDEDERLLAAMNAAFERLNQDPDARERYDAELREWDAALLDGLKPELIQAP